MIFIRNMTVLIAGTVLMIVFCDVVVISGFTVYHMMYS